MGLVLARELNQSLKIGDDITVTVARIREGQVRLRIDAPRDMPVHRREIYDSIAAGVPLRKIEERLDAEENQ